MRDFERRAGRLARMPFHARLVYTIFLVFTLIAVGLTVWLTDDMVGLDLAELGPYYAGEAPEEPAPDVVTPGLGQAGADSEGGGGPLIDMPEDFAPPAPTAEPMARRKLLEVTHFHLFSMPVYLLILSHLFMLSRASSVSKTAWIVVGTVGVAAHVAAPWVAASSGSDSAWLYASSGVALGLSFVWMSVVPLWEMWRPGRPENSNG